MTFNARNDPAVVNVPLRKRGCIDAQIDRWKADQAKAAKVKQRDAHAKRLEFQANVREAKAMIAALTDERCSELAAAAGCHKRSVRKLLRERASFHPMTVIKAIRREEANAD